MSLKHRRRVSMGKMPLENFGRKLLQQSALLSASFACVALLCSVAVNAQNKGTPGKFDFYVLDMPWGPEFCNIKDVSPTCKPQSGFVLHGMWPQFSNDSWPVFCSDEHGPSDLRASLDITPDLQLLQHEWEKHGTCSAVGPQKFFAMEHKAFRSVAIPSAFRHVSGEFSLTPEWILRSFEFENPSFPSGSFSVSCKEGKLTAVEACFGKDLQPVACAGITSCKAQVLRVGALR